MRTRFIFPVKASLLLSLVLTVVLNLAFCGGVDRLPGGLPEGLPGDVRLEGDGWTVYAPIATSIVLSVVLTLVLLIVSRLGRGR